MRSSSRMWNTSKCVTKMELTNIFWLFSFSLILISLHWLYGMIIKYIEDKPLGCQSLYDVLLRDHFMVARSTGSIYCLLAILSRNDCLAAILNNNQVSVHLWSYEVFCRLSGPNSRVGLYFIIVFQS